MIRKSILIYKNWTCSFSAKEYSLKYSNVEIVDSIHGHHELLHALHSYMCKKSKSKCKYFRITDDVKNVTIVVAKNDSKYFLKYLKEISSEIVKHENYLSHYEDYTQIRNKDIFNDISVN